MNSTDKKLSLRSALKFAPGAFVDIVLATIGLNLLALALPLTLMQVYDRIIVQHAVSTLLILSFGCAFALFLEMIVRIARDRIASWCGSRFEFKMLAQGFEALLCATMSKLDGEKTIERLEQLNSFTALKNAYFLKSIQTLIDLPFALANIFIVYLLVPKVSFFLTALVLFVLAIHLFLLFVVYVQHNREHIAHKNRDKKVMETFRHINTIRAFSFEEPILRRVEKAEALLADSKYQSVNMTTLSSSFLQTVPQAGVFGVLLIGASDVLLHRISIGVLTTCMMLAGRCLSPIIVWVSSWLHYEERESQENNANELLSIEQDNWTEDKDFPPMTGEIRLDYIRYSYPEDPVPLIKNLTLRIPKQSMICIKSNYDKASSALADLLLRNITETSGDILYDEIRINDIPIPNFYKDVHGLSAHPTFFKGTILENLASFDVSLYDEAMRATKAFGLDTAMANMDLGFTSMMDRDNIHATASGLLLRMAITRAYIKNPKVLILYGMDSNMDVDTKTFLLTVLNEMKGRCTIVCITNEASLLSMSDKVVTLENGNLLDS